MNPRYTGRKTIGLNEKRTSPTTGELNTPIVIFRSTRTPDNGSAFRQVLAGYHKSWAKKTVNERRIVDGENADADYTHAFIFRHPGFEIPSTDYVCVGKTFYRIRTGKVCGDRNEFLRVKTVEVMASDSAPFEFEEGTTTAQMVKKLPHLAPYENEFWEVAGVDPVEENPQVDGDVVVDDNLTANP